MTAEPAPDDRGVQSRRLLALGGLLLIGGVVAALAFDPQRARAGPDATVPDRFRHTEPRQAAEPGLVYLPSALEQGLLTGGPDPLRVTLTPALASPTRPPHPTETASTPTGPAATATQQTATTTATATQPLPTATLTATTTTEPPSATETAVPSAGPDRTRLPLGDGKLSTAPEQGAVWSCATHFNGGGAFTDGPWIGDDGTFDFTTKAEVDGEVAWPSQLNLRLDGNRRLVTGNDLPEHTTGVYPIQPGDDAYRYDRNPNSIASQSLVWSLPADPVEAQSPSCVGLGPIGVMVSGAYIFNALDALGRDALAHEIQDHCQGHPERSGAYHYHSPSTCVDDPGDGHSNLEGYALDGFGIFGSRGEDGQELSSGDLDTCHGHTHVVEWDGQPVEMYHYHLTWDYPYSVGCYRGTPVRAGGP